MLKAFGSAVIAFAISFLVLMAAERLIHRLSRNANRSYVWGVWIFSVLIAVYFFVTNLGQ